MNETEHADLRAAAEQPATIGAYEVDLDTGASWASPVFMEIHGLDADEPPGARDYSELVHPDDRAGMDRLAARLAEGSEPIRRTEWRIVRPDGALRRVRCTATLLGAGNGRLGRLVGAVEDVTDSGSHTFFGLHLAVASAIAAWPTGPAPAEALLRELAEPIGGRSAVVWARSGDDGPLLVRQTWAAEGHAAAPLGRSAPAEAAWASAVPVEDDGRLAFPVLHHGAVIAAVEVDAAHEVTMTATVREVLMAVGMQLGRLFATHQADFGVSPLRGREREILQAAADGAGVAAVAQRLTIAESTVKTHLEHIHAKLCVSSRPAAVAAALRLGLIE